MTGPETITFDPTVFCFHRPNDHVDGGPARAEQYYRDGDDRGPGGGCDGQRRRVSFEVFQVDNGVTATLSGLTISGGARPPGTAAACITTAARSR